jgi:hypothetical protein
MVDEIRKSADRSGMFYSWTDVPNTGGDAYTQQGLTLTKGFYDPVNDTMFEPELTGFSYSFTSDGYYEEAYYRAIANRT